MKDGAKAVFSFVDHPVHLASVVVAAVAVDPPLPSIGIAMGLGAFLLGLGATPLMLSSAFVLPPGELR